MSWRARPPSQFEMTGGSASSPSFWMVVIVAIIALAVGLVGGLVLANQIGVDRVDPAGTKAAAKRAKLVAHADRQLASVARLHGAALLGNERTNVCVTGKHNLLGGASYDSACGVQVSVYLAIPGTPESARKAARVRLAEQHIPPRADFQSSDSSGPLPKRLHGTVVSTGRTGADRLAVFQRQARLSIPDQETVYYTRTTTFDLSAAYHKHRNGHPVVTRISLVAQYAWT